ncbi:MAG TPA: kynureninase [Geminicoccaceae bacterium]|nr:kynureninase [Geminicoccaceae bacterium]
MSGLTRDEVAARDADDPLAPFRDRFLLPDGLIYLDGNSLGPVPKATVAAVARTVEVEWGRDLIAAWNKHGWIDLQLRVGEAIGRLIGAQPGEVVVADSTSVNLFKLLAAALRLRPGRRAVVSERGNFPTDLYIVQGLGGLLGGRLELRLVEADGIEAALDGGVAALMLTHVDYRTGRVHDMARLTEAAHAAGALALWDLAHSAGALPLDLAGCGADLAVGCGYKYLNGGPGAPAFLYVAERLQGEARQPLAGWFGHARPFAFDPEYRPAAGITRFQCGTPPVLSLRALEAGVGLAAEADLRLVRAKSVALTDLFIRLVERECGGHGFALASPREGAVRGSQVSLRHPEGYPIVQALIRRGVVGDFRSPDILRFGFAPLYVRYGDVWDAVATLREVMETRAWDRPEFKVWAAVT